MMDHYSCLSGLRCPGTPGQWVSSQVTSTEPGKFIRGDAGSIAQSLVVGMPLVPSPAFPARRGVFPPVPVPRPLSAFCKYLLSTYSVPGSISGKDLVPPRLSLPAVWRTAWLAGPQAGTGHLS